GDKVADQRQGQIDCCCYCCEWCRGIGSEPSCHPPNIIADTSKRSCRTLKLGVGPQALLTCHVGHSAAAAAGRQQGNHENEATMSHGRLRWKSIRGSHTLSWELWSIPIRARG